MEPRVEQSLAKLEAETAARTAEAAAIEEATHASLFWGGCLFEYEIQHSMWNWKGILSSWKNISQQAAGLSAR